MSHSVFRDLDEDKTSGNSSRGEVADNNLIVFINKDGDVQVDPNALQDLIVNANTDTKSTVSVIRVSSPTPSMETNDEDGSRKQSDVEDDDQSSEKSINSGESSEESHDDDESIEKSQKLKKTKKKKIPGIGLTVEDFYNPEQAVKFATEIMNIAGITNPRQMKADYEHLRYIIQNDHCYTPYTHADSTNEGKSGGMTDASKNNAKSKLKLPIKPAQMSKKLNRSLQSSKSTASNGLDKDTLNSMHNRSMDDANSSAENNADRSSDEEEAESETDYSEMSDSESDNDRDSDLDFSVNDCHSRRAKKIKKRKIQTKRLASKKRRRSTIDLAASDDGSTPNRKKSVKLPKKSLNTSTKSLTATSPIVSIASKSPTVSSTPRITKVSYIKETPQTSQNDSLVKTPNLQKTNNIVMPQATPITENKPKSNIIIVKTKEKKAQTENVLLSDMSSLFTPDVIKNNSSENIININKPHASAIVTKAVVIESISKPVTQVIQTITTQNTAARITTIPKLVKSPTVTFRKVQKSSINLASEQDKQLDLIDSLVQEELRKSGDTIPTSGSQAVIPAAIPNIVKMLETSEATSSLGNAEFSQPSSTSNTIPITYSTTQPSHDAQMLPDDLLESFVNSDYLSDDLMQHVAKLVEDKNLQEVIDQQVLGVTTIPTTTLPHPQIQTSLAMPKSNIHAQIPDHTPTKLTDDLKSIVKTPTTSTLVTSTSFKEGIRVKRADGRIITLPPIEAPTTRGAKRRAETTPGSEVQKKQKVFTVIVQTEPHSQNQQKSQPNTTTFQSIKAPTNSLSKSIPIAVRERRASVAVKRASLDTKPRRSLSISNPPVADDEDDDEEDGSDGSYNSEDDPHRLWCICRTPHNNRFMICCDKCEEWFHGKCVGVTRQMGRDMEERQTDWICPNCVKKQQPSIKNIFPRKITPTNSPTATKEAGPSSSTVTQSSTIPNCIVCGTKPSRLNSIYCSDDCIRKYASKAVNSTGGNPSEPEASAATNTTSFKSTVQEEKKIVPTNVAHNLLKDKLNHVVLFEKTTGKFLAGKNAPTVDKLQQWLIEHPHHEVVKSNTQQAMAFKAKQQQLKSIGKKLEYEKELFAVTQPMKIQTKLRLEADKMVYINPTTHKQVTTNVLKRPISVSSSTPQHTKSPVHKSEPISKTPKLTSTPVQKVTVQKKRTPNTPEAKTPNHSQNQSKSESSNSKSNERDRLRINARKTLIEQLLIRTKEITDPNGPRLNENEITEFVNKAEKEMFNMFGGDTNMKYKSKYRSLMYNIKDRKNLTLFEKISNKMIEPKQLVRLSTEELASQELAKWRENENKHQLEMITKSELDMLACGNSYVLKTHKGEEVIQETSDRITLDPSIPVMDVVSVLNSSTVVSSSDLPVATKNTRFDKYLSPDSNKSLLNNSSKKDGERSQEKKDRHESRSSSSSSKHKRRRSRDKHSSHSSHGHSHKDKSHDKDRKERSFGSDKKDEKEHKSSSSSSSSGSNRGKHHSDKDRKRESISKMHSSTPKIQKTDENSMIDKILKAQSTIDSILHPEEFKKNDTISTPNVSSASTSEEITLNRQTSVANESDQEPTSTVTIPSPTEVTPEFPSTTPPLIEKSTQSMSIVWSGSISMVDVATFQVSLSPLSGSTAMIEFPKEFDVVGRINPDTVWDYLSKIRASKDIVLLRFSPRSSSEDDETAYSTFIQYLDTRKRLGVIKIPSKLVKDFYIMPLTSHKSLPSILKTTTGFDLGADRPDLLLGIIVRNRISQPNHHLPIPTKSRQPLVIPFIGHKPAATIKENLFTPPSSPNMSVQTISKPVIKATFSSNLDDDEPYSPGGSDEDDLSLNKITYLSSTNVNQIVDCINPSTVGGNALSSFDKQQLEELNRQIEAEKKEIAMHLQTVDTDEPYSPTSSVSSPINTLSNISIPANLVDILKNVASLGPTSNQYSAGCDEYVPVATASSSISYAPTLSLQPVPVSSEPSKLAQLTDEELLRLVPDEID